MTYDKVMFKVKDCPAHKQRYNQRSLNVMKTITLYRKVVFDTSMEKLIIVTANVTFKQGVQRMDNSMLIDQEIDSIIFKIHEPEVDSANYMEV
jgi:hypothetical protein